MQIFKCPYKTFNSEYTDCDHISDIWDDLVSHGVSESRIAAFLVNKGDLSIDPRTSSKEEIIDALEYACRKGNKKCLGPGAMSNFPTDMMDFILTTVVADHLKIRDAQKKI
jgi:hypothetical protein